MTWNNRLQKLLSTQTNVSHDCRYALNEYFKNPFRHNWTMKMWDSNGHFPSGILVGTFFEPGNFDECLKIKSVDNNGIEGKYCIMEIKLPPVLDPKNPPLPSNMDNNGMKNWYESIRFIYDWQSLSGINNGICLPSSCSDVETNEIVTKVLIPVESSLRARIRFCQERKTQTINVPIRMGEKIIWTIFFGHLFLVAIGTIMELFIKGIESNEGMLGILICFSLIENTRTLFRISRSKHHESTGEKTQFKFIHGLRVLSIYWVVLAHVLLFHPFTQYDDLVPPVHSLNTRFSIIQNVFAHFVVNAGLAVETFFFISGTLTVYTILTTTAERSNQSINIFTYIWLRWIRFTPPLLGATCLLLLWPRIGQGPLFHSDYIGFITEPCYQNWYLSFGYISNLFPSEKVCNVMHWYLSADFQLHILLYVVIYFFTIRRSLLSFVYSYIMIGLGFFIPIIIVLLGWGSAPNPSIFLHPNYRFPIEKVELFIFATWNHFIPYFVGALFGLWLVQRKHQNNQMSKWKRYLIWIILGPLFMMQPFGSYSFIDSDKPVDQPLISAIMFGLVRSIWSLGILWLCWQCVQQQGGIIQRFLESEIMQPFSRLSFSIYLVHIIPIWHYMYTIRQPVELSLFNLLFIGIGSGFISTLLAFFLYCTFERPYVRLVKILLFNSNRSTTNNYEQSATTSNNNNNNNNNNTVIDIIEMKNIEESRKQTKM
ncbi:hypothetical protein HUG17_8218 [Dermatophagoides farinae]|uniref:Nose resistant-to-fluoxetine protein N-terminal domain-containing protein n=1 Tax=Dermatophagoides farinae TaxID=6954 RepID=A0A9D4SFW2_DERFA|nr:hypothetical protein HUG17_8218 [Dermatophagoides farinae]